MKAPYGPTSYIKNLQKLRRQISNCPNRDWRQEGLACTANVTEPEYLCNIIPQDHPDRRGIFQWLTDDYTYWNW